MSVSMLDTHRAVKRLIEAGFSSDQAETVTDMLRETRMADLADVATKADLQGLETDIRLLKADVQALAASTKADVQALAAATKADLRAVEATLKADMRAVETTLKADIRSLEGAMNTKIADGIRITLQWTIGLFLAEIAIIGGLIKFLIGH